MEMKEGQQLILGVTEFDKAEDAEKVVESLRAPGLSNDISVKTIDEVFCPVIGNSCRMDCASFMKAQVAKKPVQEGQKQEPEKFIVIGHRCISPLVQFVGPR